MRSTFWKFAGLYGVLIVAAIPLIFRWVPPNRWYGFRFPGALVAPEAWYEINALGGMLVAIAMTICLAVNGFLLWKGTPRLLRNLGWINALMILLSFWLVTLELVDRLP